MKKARLLIALVVSSAVVFTSLAKADLAPPTDDFLYKLKESLVKVSSSTKTGGHGYGTGVAISKDLVLTNCHVIQNSDGISVAKWGVAYPPVGLQADWKHDLCILRFEWADFTPVELGDSESLQYEQDIISISMPGDSPAPYISLNKVKALYPLDGSRVMRSSAAFAIGASGSPVFDYKGKLIATSTFKSPGHGAYYYNMPVEWVKRLMKTDEMKLNAVHESPFWDTPENVRPFFMRVVIPLQNEDWPALHTIAKVWLSAEPQSDEANFYLALAEKGLGHVSEAKALLNTTLKLNPQHADALLEQVKIATDTNMQGEVENIHQRLIGIDADLEEAFQIALLGSKAPIKN